MTSAPKDRVAFAAVVAVLGVALAGGVAGLAQDASSPVASPAGSPMASPGASPAASPLADRSTAGAVTVTVESYDIYFEPKQVTIPASTDVRVMLPNKGAAPHSFVVDPLGINVQLQPGETKETTINAPAGTYEYYCDVPGHKPAGMVGTLTVA